MHTYMCILKERMRERQQDLTARELSVSLMRDSEQQEETALVSISWKSLKLVPQLTRTAFSGHSQQFRP